MTVDTTPRTGISVVVPAFNSEATLPELIERLGPVLEGVAPAFEVVLVNDGSRDRTWDVIQGLTDHYGWVRGVNLMRNYGQHNALLCGIRAASYDVIVTIDDDLQHPPEEIPRVLAKLAEGHDVVYATPREEQHGLWRDLASQITKLALQTAMDAHTARHTSAFRAFRTQVRDAFAHYRSPFVSIDVLLTWGTTRFASIDVTHHSRQIGRSNYTFRKLVTHAVNMVTGFSTWPLQLASLLGFACTFVGLAVFVYVVTRAVVQGSIPGFPFLASTIAIFSGAQLFALGVIGEYLARVHLSATERPVYTVRTAAGPIREHVHMQDEANGTGMQGRSREPVAAHSTGDE